MPETRNHGLLILLLLYGAASFFHHIHNAAFLHDYPNMPSWLSPAGVLAAWGGVTAVGLAGYLLVRRGYVFTGLGVVALYGAYGFDSSGHYGLAPVSAHTLTMNLTIWLEMATAMLLLMAVGGLAITRLRGAR